MERPLRVLVCSGNMGNALPDPESIAAWIPEDGSYSQVVKNPDYPLPDLAEANKLLKDDLQLDYQLQYKKPTKQEDDYFDIIVVGMQEATFAVEGEDGEIKKELIPIVEPLLNKAKKNFAKTAEKGFATVTTLTGSTDHTSSPNVLNKWLLAKDSTILYELLAERCPSYDFCVRFQRGEMRLEILARKGLAVKVLSVRAQNTGLVNLAANKGGIVGELAVDGTTRLTFCTAHLEAHEGYEKYKHRCQMLTNIFDGTSDTSISGIKYDLSLKSHYCFVLGDLNFRTEIDPDLDKDEHRARVMTMVEQKDWYELNKADELFRALRQKDMAVGFQTLPCFFPPTFKVQRGDGYEYNEKRRPSYTDRILWKCGDKLKGLTPMAYEPIDKFVTSDHKPIRGAFEIELNQPVKLRVPRMQKRRSIYDLMKPQVMGGPKPQETTQSLHIYITNLKCKLTDRSELLDSSLPNLSTNMQKHGGKPDPVVAFLSFPKQLVQEERTLLQKIKRRLGAKDLKTKTGEDGRIDRTSFGWPRTRKLTGTYEPDWGTDEIHLTVKSHTADGKVLNHTGSLLYFSVFDTSGPTAIHMGTFPFNLAELCVNAGKARRSVLNGRASVFIKTEASSELVSYKISEPLLKYGRQTGWISCDLDAVWLDNSSKSLQDVKQSKRRR